jgi:hypothetical protein
MQAIDVDLQHMESALDKATAKKTI